MERQKQSQLNVFQIKFLNWYIVQTLNGKELAEQFCPHFHNTNECEWFLKEFPNTEINEEKSAD